MFYSHEILTNRRYGVATVWLVATLGAKSSTKKVTRKAILDVEIKKACETIMEPEAPMALRLQSNLLYGVSRVYSQQCGYVLADAQIIQNNLRTLIKVTRTAHNELDPEAGKARSDQLIIADDPAFLPDMALPPLELDFSGLELHGIDVGESQRSMMPPGRRASSASSSQNSASVLGLNLPSSSVNGGAGSYQLPDPFSGSSANKETAGTGRIFDEEEQALFDDGLNLDFGFDADGNLLGFTDEELEQRRRAASRAASIIRPVERLGSDSAASGRVRAEHQEARTGRDDPPVDQHGYFDMMQYGEEMLLPDTEPFPFMSGANPDAGHRDPLQKPSSPQPSSETESAEAPQKRRKARKPKTLPVDRELEHSNSQLLRWQREYSSNMAKAIKEKEVHQKASQSKKVAYNYVWGSGIGGVGYGIGSTKYQSPLAMFSGEALMARLKGPTTPKVKAKKANKRSLETDNEDDSNSEGRRVRARGEEEEVGRGMDFNNDVMMAGDDSMGLEVGRDAPSALDDHRSSNMPWNVSASVHSYQRGHSQPSSSLQGRRSHIPSSIGRRIPTSPLIGRGSNIPGDLEHFSQLQDADLPIMYGRSNDEDDDAILRHTSKGFSISSSHAAGAGARFNENEEAEFEIFGAAANVDTQTAGSSQWIREALDRESHNFFEYVKNSISEKQNDELDESDESDGDDVFGTDKGRAGRRGMKDKWVTFEELFVPEKNSRIVAAQAFLHVLSLATKGRVWVVQDDDENEAYGEIRIGCLGV